MRRPALIALVAFLATAPVGSHPASAQLTAEEALATAKILPSVSGCASRPETDEVVVCGRRMGGRSPYRIPEDMPDEAGSSSRRIAGEAPRASVEPISLAGCGIFEGQRRCNKRDAAEYGYGQGRDPITFVGRIISALADEDE